MLWFTENNWFTWQYGKNGPLNGRSIPNEKFITNYSRCNEHIGSFQDELVKAAKSTVDYYNNKKLVLLFSGGVDSETVLLSYLKIGHPIDVHIYRYENDYNLYDVSYAVAICNSLGISYKLIDFNFKKFLETEGEKFSKLSEINLPGALPHLKFLELTDGVPIMGMGDPFWVRIQGNDYTIKGWWCVQDREFPAGFGKFLTAINKEGIPYWLKWTPGLSYSYTNLSWFKKLTNDELIGEINVRRTKIIGYREAYPCMLQRQKQTGVEKVEGLVNEFRSYLNKKSGGEQYLQISSKTLEDFRSAICPPT